jgi:hypothetical protein
VCYCAGIKEWAIGILLYKNKRVVCSFVTVQEYDWAIGVIVNEVLRRILRTKEYRVKK